MEQTTVKNDTALGRRKPLAKKSRNFRTIAELPYRGTVSVKIIDAAIKAVMAKRDAETARVMSVVVPLDEERNTASSS